MKTFASIITTVLLVVTASVDGQFDSIDYSPCSYSTDMTQTYYTIKCQAPLTAADVITAFSKTPINDKVKDLTITDISDMNDNQMSNVMMRLAPSMDVLYRLSIDRNALTFIPAEVARFNNLVYLSASNNAISYLPTGTLNISSPMLYLGLQANQMETIAPGAFAGNYGLTRLGLQANSVYSFSAGVFKDVLTTMASGEGSINLGGNPISCDCSLAWLIRDNRQLLPSLEQAVCSNGLDVATLNPLIFQNCPSDA
jgi:Leucine-rich repeat (LRR) protein